MSSYAEDWRVSHFVTDSKLLCYNLLSDAIQMLKWTIGDKFVQEKHVGTRFLIIFVSVIKGLVDVVIQLLLIPICVMAKYETVYIQYYYVCWKIVKGDIGSKFDRRLTRFWFCLTNHDYIVVKYITNLFRYR